MTTNKTHADKFCVYSNPYHLHYDGTPIWYVVQIIQGEKYETTGFVIKAITRWSSESEARKYVYNLSNKEEVNEMKKTKLSDFQRRQKELSDHTFIVTIENVKQLLHDFRGNDNIDVALNNLNEALEKVHQEYA